MFSTGVNYGKLKTNLRLVINRLKLLEKKKTELALKARKEIADYISSGKYERAKIRVEHIIREDYLVEAMEMVEMYCDLVLARFGLVQQVKSLEDGIAEPICSILWASPRLQADVPELKIISDQLSVKYGKPYVKACMENAVKTVNESLMHRLSIHAPPKLLVEKYLMEIAKSHNVEYEPDPDVMRETDAVECLEGNLIALDNNDNFKRPPSPGFIFPNGGGASGGHGGGGSAYPPMQYPSNPLPQVPFNYPSLNTSLPPPYSEIPIEHLLPEKPPYKQSGSPKPVPAPRKVAFDTLPELPSVPTSTLTNLNPSAPEESVNFDDLSKRFEELKKRT